MADLITDHVQQALDRMLEQYKGKPRIEGVITSFTEQTQDSEDVIHGLTSDLAIATAIGIQLDLIGTIVVQDRLGFSDDIYRRLLLAKIGENVSKSTPENVIDVVKLLTDSSLVHFQEYYPAGYGIGIDKEIDPSLVDFFYQRIDRVDPAAVRLEALICFDDSNPFAFEGGPTPAGGFGDLTDANVGGLFAKLHIRLEPAFSFAPPIGQETTDQGFGDLNDNNGKTDKQTILDTWEPKLRDDNSRTVGW